MEDALAGTNADRAAGRHLAGLGFLSVLVAPDVRARRPAGYEVVALGVLDLSYVLPFDCVFPQGRDQVWEVVCRWLVICSKRIDVRDPVFFM